MRAQPKEQRMPPNTCICIVRAPSIPCPAALAVSPIVPLFPHVPRPELSRFPRSSKRGRVGQETMASAGGVLRSRRVSGADGGGLYGLSFLYGRKGAPTKVYLLRQDAWS